MKLLVFSDTHGLVEKALKICRLVTDADVIVHLGDNKRDALKIKEESKKQVLWVNGNCDYGRAEDDFHILETEYGNIFLAHGHKEGVKYGVQQLSYKAEKLGCKAAFFGHTHMAGYQEMDGMHILNPGSLSIPRDGSRGSYAVVQTTKDHFEASIIYLE